MKTWSYIFAAVGLLALGYWVFEFASARLFQVEETRRFVREQAESHPADTSSESKPPVAKEPAAKTPGETEPPYPSVGSTIAMLRIPRLELSTIVLEGAEERELKLGPGHIPGTPLPGKSGNVGVAGHRDTVFRPLRSVRISDTISVSTQQREYQYKVVSTEIVGPKDVRVLYPTGHETLTLVTCYPFNFVGAAPQRFIVHADCTNCSPAGSQEASNQ
jgi:sortase A